MCAKSATGAVPELHCQQTLRATRAFLAMPALHCPRQPMTRDTTIASNKAGTDLREFWMWHPQPNRKPSSILRGLLFSRRNGELWNRVQCDISTTPSVSFGAGDLQRQRVSNQDAYQSHLKEQCSVVRDQFARYGSLTGFDWQCIDLAMKFSID
jgi:hypothetical protein